MTNSRIDTLYCRCLAAGVEVSTEGITGSVGDIEKEEESAATAAKIDHFNLKTYRGGPFSTPTGIIHCQKESPGSSKSRVTGAEQKSNPKIFEALKMGCTTARRNAPTKDEDSVC